MAVPESDRLLSRKLRGVGSEAIALTIRGDALPTAVTPPSVVKSNA